MAKEKEINIGHDPLAWMAEGNAEEVADEATQNEEISDESVNQTQQAETVEETQSSISESESESNGFEVSTESPVLVDSPIVEAVPEIVEKVEEIQEEASKSEMDNVMQVSEKNDWITINLPNNMTLPYLDDLQAQLHDFLGQPIHFAGENVQRVDTAALQLLLSFIQENKDIRWENPSNQLCNAASLLNLSSHLNLPAS